LIELWRVSEAVIKFAIDTRLVAKLAAERLRSDYTHDCIE
jgi:hypothetical protein